MTTTYDLVRWADDLAITLMKNGGEVTQEVADELDEFQAAGESKADAIAYLIRSLESTQQRYQERAQHFQRRVTTAQRGVASLRGLLLRLMEARERLTGETSLRTDEGTYILGESVKVTVAEVDYLPSEYVRHSLAPDKRRIRAALEGGAELRGCALVRTPKITIR